MALVDRTIICLLTAAVTLLPAANSVSLPELDIGSRLQTSAVLTLTEPAPENGLTITVSSDDPAKVLFSKLPDQRGKSSLVLQINPGLKQSAEFWVQALAVNGTVGYTATEPTIGKFNGTIRLHPSAVAVVGPYRAPWFATTPRALPSHVVFETVRLDASGKIVDAQYVTPGETVKLTARTSDPKVGKVEPAELEIPGGSAAATAIFQPAGAGKTVIDVLAPGLAKPATEASITAQVNLPGILFADEGTLVGQNLQLHAVVGLGEAPPEEGVKVRVECSDPSRLIVSASASEVGKGAIEIPISGSKATASIYLQGLAREGSVTCSASAPGFRTRTSEILLAPSGVVLMYRPYGPPDEAEVLRDVHHGPNPTTTLYMHLGKTKTIPLNIWTVRLDPVTLRSADITVQPLRAGYDLEVDIQTSNPEIGSISTPIKIAGGSEVGSAEFKPKAEGKTVLTVVTPSGFVKSTNSSSVTTVIKP